MNEQGQVVAYTPGEDQPAAPNPIEDPPNDINVETETATGNDLELSGDRGNGVIFTIVAILAGLAAVAALGLRRSND